MLLLPAAIAMCTPLATLADPTAVPPAGLDVQRYELAANQDVPELCFVLSESVARQPATPLENFIAVEPAAALSVTPRNDRLCLTGFGFGNGYTVTLKAGLPGIGRLLAKDVQFRIDIPTRPPELDFPAPHSDVLPRIGADGLPIRSVNVPKIDVRISRVDDDDLLWDAARSGSPGAQGETVWQGSVEPKGSANQDTVTMLPIETTIGALKPGRYVATAWQAGLPIAAQNPSSQPFTVSDLGLSAYRGPDSLLVAARSLATAAAAPGIDLALVADNNRELGRTRTDGNGFARFDSALLRGREGDRPRSVRAYGPAGEFAVISLTDPDRPDRPRPRTDVAPIHLDRASYQPGERADILALLRSDQGTPIVKRPLTVTALRPDGSVFSVSTLSDQGDGGYNLVVDIPETGSTGTWRIEARREGDPRPIGTARFDVSDSPDSRLSLSVNSDVAVADPTQAVNVIVQAQTADGQPAVNVPGELRVRISGMTAPFPAFPGFSFSDSAVPAETQLPAETLRFTTDAAGRASVPVKIVPPAKTMRPLQAEISTSLFDTAGRPVERTIDVPIATHPLMLGVRAAPDAIFAPGQSAHFELIAVSPDGARQEKPGAGWEILRREMKPSWVADGFRYALSSSYAHVAGGQVDISANMPASLDVPNLAAGFYRIEVFDPNGEAITNTEFSVGWSPGLGAMSDGVILKPAKPSYSAGDGIDLFVKPPFDADVMLMTADPDIRDAVVQHVPAAGATVHLTLPRDAGLATQLSAVAVAPADAAAPGLPRRASGRITIPADPAQRSLDVKIDLPPVAMPQRTLSIPVTVTGAGEDPAYVRVALTDERGDGLESDTPLDTLIARQDEMTDVRDNYGRIITPSGLAGAFPAEADTTVSQLHPIDPPGLPQTPLALYSGIVPLDKGGKGTVLLTLPDYAGNVRISVLAWAANRTGQTQAALAVHYPLNTTLPLPAYLAQDDRADLTLTLDNMDGPRGEYRVKIHGDGAVSVQDEAETVINLAEHEQRTQAVAIQAHGAGDGTIVIGVKGPGNLEFERRLPLTVRGPSPRLTRHAVIALKPGATLTADPGLTANLRPEGLAFSAAVGGANDLDLVGIAHALTATQPNSADRIVAAATPDLAAETLRKAAALADRPAKDGLNQAVQALAAYQAGDGGFGDLGSPKGQPWLSASVADFLTRAKAKGATVPDTMLGQVLDYLTLHIEPEIDPSYSAAGSPQTYAPEALAAAAYANEVLAANGRLTQFQLRYFSDRFLSRMRTPVGAAFIAAAFADLGDKSAAAAAFARAATLPADTLPEDIFGSDLRDQALLNALMAESGAVAQPSIAAVAAKTAQIAAAHRQFNPQEAAWLLRAGIASAPAEVRFKAKIGDKTVDQGTVFTLAVAQSLPAIKNTGDMPLHVALTVSGMPAPGEVKDQGYELQRWLFDGSGKQIDPGALHQGDVAVVVLTGRFTGQGEAQPLLFDPLPAGWRVEAANIVDPGKRYPWLKDLSESTPATIIDGIYSVMPRLTGDKREFRVAYVIRATVRGQFGQPGTLVEDRIQPAQSARTAAGKIKVDPAL
jgi:uncharacterized protein YfaS (alpha-2-macroglobulin family)